MGRSTLHDRLDADFAEAWKPEPGDELIGEVTELSERDAGFGSYPIVTVRQEGGERLAFHACRKVAKSQLARACSQVGDQIGIRYQGMVKGRRNDYVGYKVVVEHTGNSDQPGFDWSPYDDDGGVPPGAERPDGMTREAEGDEPGADADVESPY